MEVELSYCVVAIAVEVRDPPVPARLPVSAAPSKFDSVNPADIQDRLQQALGTAYIIERELGGGGMSRVFVAQESALGRKVVIKVLRPELAEALSAERFKREVRLAAKLQHPHIVPLLSAGQMGGGAAGQHDPPMLYYTMP